MTIDDRSSVYVGGIPFDADEELVRRAFDQFGEVVAVKIVGERGYGFVTFTNPEDASKAISGMNGQHIGGRLVKVNEVRNGRNGPKFSSGRDNMRNNRDWDRDRDDRRDWNRDDDRNRDRDRDGRGRYFSPRQSTRRSPARSNRNASPQRQRSPRGRSRSPSVTRGSVGRYDEPPRSRHSSEKTGDNMKLRDELARTAETQQDRRDQVASLQNELHRSHQALSEAKDREKKLESALERSKATADRNADHLRRMQHLRLDIRECRDRLAYLEREYEILAEVGVESVENLDTQGHYDNRQMPNGYADEKRTSESQ